MRRIVHCTVAVLCAAGTASFAVLTVSQSFINIIFAVTGAFLTHWQLDRAGITKMELSALLHPRRTAAMKKAAADRERVQKEVRAVVEEMRVRAQQEEWRIYQEKRMFQNKYRNILNAMAKEYSGYVNEAFRQEQDVPLSYHIATERMMEIYGHDVYTAFRDTRPYVMPCLSERMFIADLNAARRVVSRIVS